MEQANIMKCNKQILSTDASALMRNHLLTLNARALRKNSTEAEKVLWKRLRSRKFSGYKFRRQHVVGDFILDFYCAAAKLAIELDGGGHALKRQVLYDVHRTGVIEGRGIHVLRFWNHEVLQQTEAVLAEIFRTLTVRSVPGNGRAIPGGQSLVL